MESKNSIKNSVPVIQKLRPGDSLFNMESKMKFHMESKMKRLLIALAMMSLAFMANAQSCPDDNHPHMIDLGLPSGTKWACCNLGADKPEAYGSYYAWGETDEGKNNYAWSTYIHCDGDWETCHDLGSDIAGTQYDVAHVKWGDNWVMPSVDQFLELLNNCSIASTTMNGVSGGNVTGPNGSTIFLPLAGYRQNDTFYNGNFCQYWSSSLCPFGSRYAYVLFSSGKAYYAGQDDRCIGHTVRPVVSGINFIPLQISSSTLKLTLGEQGVVEIISGNGSYSAESSDAEVATAVVDGTSVKVTALGEGTAIIIVTDTKSSATASIEVTVSIPFVSTCPDDNHPHMIDLGLPSGTKWACCNVGADKPEAYGGYYAWGETEEKDVYNDVTYLYSTGEDINGDGHYDDNHDDTPPDIFGYWQNLGDDIAGTQYDVAHVKWGGNWQMPTSEQIDELVGNCTYSRYSMNGVEGGKFTGPNGVSILLPAAGSRLDDKLHGAGYDGAYWLSIQNPSNLYYAYYLSLYNHASLSNNSRGTGNTVRPVVSGTSNIILLKSSADDTCQTIYDIYGIKVADNLDGTKNLHPGIYIVNGKKVVVK